MKKIKTGNPEKVIKRKSYYGFARRYPGAAGDDTYLIGDSRKVKRKKTVKKILVAALMVVLFAAAYIVTAAALLISNSGG